jgi:hypothetical protein
VVFSNNLLAGSGGQSTGYEIENSLRFNSADSAFLENEDYSGSPTSGTDCTFSFWVKRSKLSSTQCLFFGGDASGSTWEVIRFESDDQFRVGQASSAYDLITTQVFRDVASWYHFVVAFDTDNGTAGDRIKIYVNGSRVTDFSLQTNPSSGYVTNFNTGGSGEAINIGFQGGGSNYCDLYLAEINFIDGQALTPTSFGEFSSTTGQWVPIDTSGLTFGNNGYHLEFKDSSFIGKSTYQRTGNEGMIPQDAGTIIKSSAMGFSETISFDNAINTDYPTVNQWRLDIQPDDGCFIGKDYGADNKIVATGFKVYPTGAPYYFDTWTNGSSSSTYSLQLQGSNDGTNYTNIGAANTSVNGASSATKVSGLSNSTAYRYVRLLIDGVGYGGTQHWFAVSEIEFFGVGTYFNAQGISTADQMTDTPTNNTCTLNQLITPATTTIVNGSLDLSGYTASSSAYGTFGMSSGKWYWELVAQANAMAGIAATPNGSQYPGQASDSYAFDLTNGTKYNGGSSASFGSSAVSAGHTVGVAFDADNGDLKFYNNSGSLIGTAYSSLTSGPYFPVFRNGNSANISINFGQQTFSHSIPTSHAKLTVPNLPDPTIADPSEYFQTVLYTGSTSAQDITFGGNSDLAPDWLWFKARSAASNNFLFDKVRGVNKGILSDATTVETTYTNSLTAFGTDGFSLGDGGSSNDINGVDGTTYVAWGWAAGNSSGSSNTDGSVTSTVSANTTAGFSICKFNPGGNVNMTFGHGLGTAPRLVIVKNLEDATNWQVLHLDQGVGNKLFLNSTNAAASDANMWQNTAPTSTVVSMGTAQTTNEDVIAYCFAEIPGYSKISKFVGNGNADGTFVFTGFKPAFILTKNIDTTDQWGIRDSARNPFNVTDKLLNPNANSAETSSSTGYIDILSNGFKARSSDSNINSNTIIYMAIAESPFKTANAR